MGLAMGMASNLNPVQIGDHLVGDGLPVYVVGEIGINHNGDREILRELIREAAKAKFDAVKFQKRTVDVVYREDQLLEPRKSPWGTTNGALKYRLELALEDYAFIDEECARLGLQWFASCWDPASVDFIERFHPPCYKIASPCATDIELLEKTCDTGKPIILSTGMLTGLEMTRAMNLIRARGNPLVLMHCVSAYPAPEGSLNLRLIANYRDAFGVPIGYSSHESWSTAGRLAIPLAIGLGARMIERHVTIDNHMFGSDQAASSEPWETKQIMDAIRATELMLGDGFKRVRHCELPHRKKLMRFA